MCEVHIPYITQEEWISSDLYQQLIGMPWWVAAAFSKDGEFFIDETRESLIHSLVIHHIHKYPYDKDFTNLHNIQPYIPVVKQAYIQARRVLQS